MNTVWLLHIDFWQETMFLPVVYTNSRYDATNYVIDNTNKRFFAEMGIMLNCRDTFAQYKINIFKHKCWSYEREWRLMLYKMNGSKKIDNNPPIAIYLGCRIKKCYEDILIKYAREKGIKIYKMSENPMHLKYRKIPISPMLKRVMPYIDFDNGIKCTKDQIRHFLNKVFEIHHHTHELRYTFITRAKECGCNLELVMLWDGHKFDEHVKSSAVDRGYTTYSDEYYFGEIEKINYEL